MVQYKLYYFDVRGWAEMSRMILHYAGVEFEDIRFTHEEWPKYKPKMPFGQVPVLEVDGVQIAQSAAIARFLARKYGLAGKDDLEAAFVDSVADQMRDFAYETREYFMVVRGRKEGDKEKLRAEIFLPEVEKNFTKLEKLLSQSGSGFFAKSGVTWLDFLIANWVNTLKNMEGDIFEKYPELAKHEDTVNALPQLKEYLANRKETQF